MQDRGVSGTLKALYAQREIAFAVCLCVKFFFTL